MGISLRLPEFLRSTSDRQSHQQGLELKQNRRIFAWGEDQAVFPKHAHLTPADRQLIVEEPLRFVERFTGMKDREPYCGRAEINWRRIAKEYTATGVRAFSIEKQHVCVFDQEKDVPIRVGRYRVLFKDREFSRGDMDYAYGNETGLVKIGDNLYITSYRMQRNGEPLVLLVRKAEYTPDVLTEIGILFHQRS